MGHTKKILKKKKRFGSFQDNGKDTNRSSRCIKITLQLLNSWMPIKKITLIIFDRITVKYRKVVMLLSRSSKWVSGSSRGSGWPILSWQSPISVEADDKISKISSKGTTTRT